MISVLRRPRKLAVSLATVLILAVAAPVEAATVQTLSASGQYAYDPQVALDGNGYSHVVWSRYDGSVYRIQYRRRAPNGTLWATRTLSASGQYANYPDIAVTSTGIAFVAWERWDGSNWRIQLVRIATDGSVGSVQTLSTSGRNATRARVAVDTNGVAHVVWQRFGGTNWRIQHRSRATNGTLSPVTDLSASGQNASDAEAVVDPSGNLYVVWRRFDGTFDRIQLRRRASAGTFSTTTNLSAMGQHASSPNLAVDADGNVVVVWRRWDGSNYRVQAVRRAAAGSLSTVQYISFTGRDAEVPQVAMANGTAYITWQRYDGTNIRVQFRTRAAVGTLGTIKTISGSGQDAEDPRIGVDSGGEAFVIWQRYDGTSVRVQLRDIKADGTLGTIETLSASGQNAERSDIAVRGAYVAVGWQRWDGSNWRVQATVLPS